MDSTEVLEEWANRSGAYSPDYYAYYGPNETSERIRERLESNVGSDASILELGCSSGRHLSHLFDYGYEDVSGIEINGDAFDVMARTDAELAAAGTFYCESIENTVTEFADDRFDVVYSVETLQHLHPDSEWVFEELGRITGELLVTVENEGEDERERDDDRGVNYVDGEFPLYYRDWRRVFTDRGFVEVDAEPSGRATLRAFRPRSP